ncbi:MAG TPA: sulfatase-like hydrolase/transferase, partial [Thermoanaerobaculia bacterium]
MRRLVPLLLIAILAGCSRSSEQRDVSSPGAPVIIISIDTLRADRLPAWGYRGVETPAIDSLRRDSILYRNAWSHAPTTLPSHVSIFTGLLPPAHGVRNNLGYIFDGTTHKTLPRLLQGAGYASGAAVSAYVLRATTGLGAEFDSYDDAIESKGDVSVGELSRDGGATSAIAQRWINERAAQPFFYFLHLFEPHTPYAPPEPYLSRYEHPYDGEIAAVDAIVGRFLESLKANGVYDRALIILLSDHGEGLGDHGEAEHGVFLYREAIHVPLLVKLPGGARAGSTVEENVQLIDVFPTVAAVAGVKPPDGLPGRSLLESQDPSRAVYSETLLPRLHFGWSDLASLVKGNYHLIRAPRPELYDMAADPGEKTSILDSQRRQYAAMRDELSRFEAAVQAPSPVSQEEADKLAALGYLGSMRAEAGDDLPDPKDRIGDLEQMRRGAAAEREGREADALALYRAVLEVNPRFTDAWIRLAALFEKQGEIAAAEEAYRRAIDTSPELASGLALSVGTLQYRAGKLDDAAAHARLALGKPMTAAGAHLLLPRIALQRGNPAEAEREAGLAATDASRRRDAAVVVARARVVQGRLPEALQRLDALKTDPAPLLDLEATRGDTLARMNRPEEAEQAFLAEVKAFPNNREAYTR